MASPLVDELSFRDGRGVYSLAENGIVVVQMTVESMLEALRSGSRSDQSVLN